MKTVRYTLDWMALDEATVMNLFLYADIATPMNLYDRLIPPGTQFPSTINVSRPGVIVNVDAVSYMQSGPGRYALPANAIALKKFFTFIGVIPEGDYTASQMAAMLNFRTSRPGDDDFDWSMQQTDIDSNSSDYNQRVFVYNSTSFTIPSNQVTFHVAADGTRTVSGIQVRPFNDNFDFESDSIPTRLSNFLTSRNFDPDDIGHTVEIAFTNTSSVPAPSVYTSADYFNDIAQLNAWGAFGPLAARNVSDEVQSDLENSGVLEFENDDFLIRYGTEEGENLSEGESKANLILGGGGNDAITGSRNDDRLYGHEGDDNIRGLDGNDKLFGGSGGDTIEGGDGDDEIYGDGSEENYRGAEESNISDGSDTLDGGEGNDKLYGGGGADTLNGGDDDDILYGHSEFGLGDDDAVDTLDGGGGADHLYGQGGGDTLNGGEGGDTLVGGAGGDTLDGGTGMDTLYGGDENSSSDDGAADILTGGTDRDTYYVGDGDKIIATRGGDSSDVIYLNGTKLTGPKDPEEGEEGDPCDEGSGEGPPPGPPWEGNDGAMYERSGSTLTVTLGGATLTIQDFTNGDFGFEIPEEQENNDAGDESECNRDPFIIDLDGDGLEFQGITEGAYFDCGNDGFADRTAWVNGDDGILVTDLNGDGRITGDAEVFNGEGGTMAVLTTYYSNGDGVLGKRLQQNNEMLT